MYKFVQDFIDRYTNDLGISKPELESAVEELRQSSLKRILTRKQSGVAILRYKLVGKPIEVLNILKE